MPPMSGLLRDNAGCWNGVDTLIPDMKGKGLASALHVNTTGRGNRLWLAAEKEKNPPDLVTGTPYDDVQSWVSQMSTTDTSQ